MYKIKVTDLDQYDLNPPGEISGRWIHLCTLEYGDRMFKYFVDRLESHRYLEEVCTGSWKSGSEIEIGDPGLYKALLEIIEGRLKLHETVITPLKWNLEALTKDPVDKIGKE